MDSTTLAAGLASELTDFGTAYGPIILSVVGIALGVWGVVFGYRFITNLVRVRASSK